MCCLFVYTFRYHLILHEHSCYGFVFVLFCFVLITCEQSLKNGVCFKDSHIFFWSNLLCWYYWPAGAAAARHYYLPVIIKADSLCWHGSVTFLCCNWYIASVHVTVEECSWSGHKMSWKLKPGFSHVFCALYSSKFTIKTQNVNTNVSFKHLKSFVLLLFSKDKCFIVIWTAVLVENNCIFCLKTQQTRYL